MYTRAGLGIASYSLTDCIALHREPVVFTEISKLAVKPKRGDTPQDTPQKLWRSS